MTTRTEFRGLNGHDVLGAHHDRLGETVFITRPGDMPRLGWLRRGERQPRPRAAAKPGSRMIGTATALLFVLAGGLLAVSLAAQYRWLLRQRGQHWPSLIEALALDVGMLIFSLLALGLARAGKQARIERTLIVACAAGSAVMNLAAADTASARSILAYCMPAVFLAVVADRVISVVRRHYLGDEEHSPWSGLGRVVLYALRLSVAAPSTIAGARRALLVATPLPARPEPAKAIDPPPPLPPPADDDGDQADDYRPPRAGTKTAALLAAAEQRYGPLAALDLDRVGRIATDLAADVSLHPGSARTALRSAVLAAQEGGAE